MTNPLQKKMDSALSNGESGQHWLDSHPGGKKDCNPSDEPMQNMGSYQKIRLECIELLNHPLQGKL